MNIELIKQRRLRKTSDIIPNIFREEGFQKVGFGLRVEGSLWQKGRVRTKLQRWVSQFSRKPDRQQRHMPWGMNV